VGRGFLGMSDTHRFGLYVPDEDPPGDQVTTRVENVTSLSWAVSVYPDAPAPDGIPGDASNCFTGYHPPRPTCFILVTKRAPRPTTWVAPYATHPGMLREGETARPRKSIRAGWWDSRRSGTGMGDPPHCVRGTIVVAAECSLARSAR